MSASILYYNDYDSIDEDARGLYCKTLVSFGGIAPSYRIELLDKPTVYWDFHSLLLGIQMIFGFMLVGNEQPLCLCKHCRKVFSGNPSNAVFFSPRCKNQYNAYKSHETSKGGNGPTRRLFLSIVETYGKREQYLSGYSACPCHSCPVCFQTHPAPRYAKRLGNLSTTGAVTGLFV